MNNKENAVNHEIIPLMYIHEIRYCQMTLLKLSRKSLQLSPPHFSRNTKVSSSLKISCTEMIKRSLLNRATIIMNFKMQAVPIPRLLNFTIFLGCKYPDPQKTCKIP